MSTLVHSSVINWKLAANKIICPIEYWFVETQTTLVACRDQDSRPIIKSTPPDPVIVQSDFYRKF